MQKVIIVNEGTTHGCTMLGVFEETDNNSFTCVESHGCYNCDGAKEEDGKVHHFCVGAVYTQHDLKHYDIEEELDES